MFLSSALVGSVVVASLGWLAVRDHRRELGKRRQLLDACVELFDRHIVIWSGDGFPRAEAELEGRRFDLRLISDGMTIRRLPQLWLQVTELAPLDRVHGFSVLVRPTGYDFFSLAYRFHHVIAAPGSFPREVIVRGEDELSASCVSGAAAALSVILQDMRVKEISVTRRGLRIVRQVDEGERGAYLLLRQAVFNRGAVSVGVVAHMLRDLGALHAALERAPREPMRA